MITVHGPLVAAHNAAHTPIAAGHSCLSLRVRTVDKLTGGHEDRPPDCRTPRARVSL